MGKFRVCGGMGGFGWFAGLTGGPEKWDGKPKWDHRPLSLPTQADCFSNDIHKLDTSTMTWTLICTKVCPSLPSPLSDTWLKAANRSFVLPVLTPVPFLCSCQGNPARWRDFHSATMLDKNMYVFGGRADRFGPFHSNNEIYCNRIRVFDTRTEAWLDCPPTPVLPEGRRSHSACECLQFLLQGAALSCPGLTCPPPTHLLPTSSWLQRGVVHLWWL